MLNKLTVFVMLFAFASVSSAVTVDCKKNRGNEEHCNNAKADDQYQCTTYVQQQLPWVGHLGIHLQDKKSHKLYKDKSKTSACIGGVAVIDAGSYGHVGIVDADLGNTIRIRDRNYCCDGIDRVHEISKAKVTGYICQSRSRQTHSYAIRISNIDDEGSCFINGHRVTSVGYYQDTGWVDISDKLHPGDNHIEFKVKNNREGYAYSFEFREDGAIKWKKKCGEVGRKGCKDKMSKGHTLSKKFTYKL